MTHREQARANRQKRSIRQPQSQTMRAKLAKNRAPHQEALYPTDIAIFRVRFGSAQPTQLAGRVGFGLVKRAGANEETLAGGGFKATGITRHKGRYGQLMSDVIHHTHGQFKFWLSISSAKPSTRAWAGWIETQPN